MKGVSASVVLGLSFPLDIRRVSAVTALLTVRGVPGDDYDGYLSKTGIV